MIYLKRLEPEEQKSIWQLACEGLKRGRQPTIESIRDLVRALVPNPKKIHKPAPLPEVVTITGGASPVPQAAEESELLSAISKSWPRLFNGFLRMFSERDTQRIENWILCWLEHRIEERKTA